MKSTSTQELVRVTPTVPAENKTDHHSEIYKNNPTETVFPMPYYHEDGVVRPLLGEATNYFLANNVNSENIVAALIICLSLNSASLGHPVSIILTADNQLIADRVLAVCKEITPEGRFVEFNGITPQELFRSQNEIKNKAIICWNPRECKKAITHIQQLISIGYSSRRELFKSSCGEKYQNIRLEGPVAFIGVEVGDEKFDMSDPSILRIALSSNESDTNQCSPELKYSQSHHRNCDYEKSRLTRSFARLSPRSVSIPYAEVILNDLIDQRVQQLQWTFKLIQRQISLISITNNPPAFTKDEAVRYCCGQNPNQIFPLVTSGPAIAATRVEYFLMAQFLKDKIPLKDEHYSPVQVAIFEAVRKINLGKLTRSIIDQGDKVQVLKTLYRSNNYWAKIEDIFGMVNSKDKKLISIQFIEKELIKLAKLGIISKGKVLQSSDYGYFINDINIGKHVTFMNPSKISDPIFNMAQIQVVNPINGVVAII